MNHISRLQANAQLTREWTAELRVHLESEKFQGTECRCATCGTVHHSISRPCTRCDGVVGGERKDWISTADVKRWLELD